MRDDFECPQRIAQETHPKAKYSTNIWSLGHLSYDSTFWNKVRHVLYTYMFRCVHRSCVGFKCISFLFDRKVGL